MRMVQQWRQVEWERLAQMLAARQVEEAAREVFHEALIEGEDVEGLYFVAGNQMLGPVKLRIAKEAQQDG